MARKVRILKKASSDLEGILEYLDREFGKPTAIQFFKRVDTLLSILINQPEIGALYSPERRIFSFPIEKQVRIFYRFTKSEVVIISFFGVRQDPKKTP